MVKTNKLLLIIFSITIIYLILLAFDVNPYLRGPDDALMSSRWPYYFVNTFYKIWAPLSVVVIFTILYLWVQKQNKLSRYKEIMFILSIVLITFLFQLSLVYFSRFGITILFQRMTHPGINGYFSSAVKMKDNPRLLQDFPKNLYKLDQHARGHPPGSMIFLQNIIIIFENNQILTNSVLNVTRSPNNDSKVLWNKLSRPERAAALFSAFFMHFLASLSVVPVYFITKKIIDHQSAIKAVFLYAVIPSLSFFALIFDPFYAIIPILSFLLFYSGITHKKLISVFLAGLVSSLGLFFSLSILPSLAAGLIYFAIYIYKNKLKYWKYLILSYLSGFMGFQALLISLGYNILYSAHEVIRHQAPREYLDWVIFNPYDFFVYLGLPISLLFIYLFYKNFKQKELLKNPSAGLMAAFCIPFIALILTGASRGEVGRIWIPMMFIPVIMVAGCITNKLKWNNLQFILLFLLISIQVIIMEEFWVPVW